MSSNGLFLSNVQRNPFNATLISPTHATCPGHPISSPNLRKGKTCNIAHYQRGRNERRGLYVTSPTTDNWVRRNRTTLLGVVGNMRSVAGWQESWGGPQHASRHTNACTTWLLTTQVSCDNHHHALTAYLKQTKHTITNITYIQTDSSRLT
jgi:hypothetical protein